PPGFRSGYASAFVRLGRFREAVDILEENRIVAEEAGDAVALAETDMLLGRALVGLGSVEEAVPYLDRAHEFFQRAAGVGAGALFAIAVTRAQAHLVLGDVSAAERAIGDLLGSLNTSSEIPPSYRMHALRQAAEIALAAKDPERAEQLASESHAIATTTARDPARSADVGLALWLRAQARRISGDVTGAANDVRLALPSLINGLGANHPATVEATRLLRDEPRATDSGARQPPSG